jgi:mono/diheme cytochrome c family protein
MRPILLAPTAALAALALLALVAGPAEGETKAERLMREALARGQEIFEQARDNGAKSCAECHREGPNKMKGQRLGTYPKYDKTGDAFLSAQQKINQMLVEKSGATALELGSADMNALEAYLRSLR